jgi:hypothetical protein
MGLGACSYAMAACVVETKFLGIYIQRDETQTGQWQLRPQATVYNSRGKIARENHISTFSCSIGKTRYLLNADDR